MRIGAIIKQHREARGWTQSELAAKTGNVITQAMVSRIESGEDNVKIDTLRGLARAFGCHAADLLPEEDQRTTHGNPPADAPAIADLAKRLADVERRLEAGG
jgi:transcriptional regulator with XRE-family HTH domain